MRGRVKNSPLLTQSAEAKSSRVASKPDRRHPALGISLFFFFFFFFFFYRRLYSTVGLMVEC